MVAANEKDLIFLDRNENQYGPSPECFKVLQNSNDDTLNIYSRDFSRGIKSLLSARLAYDYGTEEKKILLGYGSEDILKQVVQCYINKGEKIMIPSFSWWYYKKIVEDVDGISIEYPIVEGEHTFYYDIEGTIKIYNEQKPKLVIISSPNNPTGNRLETNQLNFVLEKMKDSIVVLDEAYLFFDVTFKTDPVGLVNRYPNLIILRTFSKYYALAGIRTGFAFLGDNLDRISLLGTRYLGFNRLSEKIAIAALNSPEYYNSISLKMAEDMNMLYNELNQWPGFTAYRSFANFIMVKIPPEIKDSLKEYLTERNMIIKFMNEEELNRHLRITIGTHPQNCFLLKLIKTFMCKEMNHELVQGI